MEFVSCQCCGLLITGAHVSAHSHRYSRYTVIAVKAVGSIQTTHSSLALSVCLSLWLYLYLTGMSGWAGCLDGQDIFAKIRENSLSGYVVAELLADTMTEGVYWSLDGKDADWFFLDERNIRLNTSADKVLDREVTESGNDVLNTDQELDLLFRMQGSWFVCVQP